MNKICNKNKEHITKRFLILFLSFYVLSYIMKIFGSNIFEFVANDERINNICIFIENNLILNLLCYGILNFILVYFITFYISKRFGSKNILLNLIIFIFAFGINILRYYFNGWIITFLFDFIQYILFPCIVSIVVYKNNVEEVIMNSLIMYFCINGLLMVSSLLNNFLIKVYSLNIIYQFVTTFELYIFVISIFLYKNYRRLKDVENN